MILMATFLFGLLGVMIGFIGLLYYMCNLRSYGQPYLKLFTKEKPLPEGKQERSRSSLF
ncbi:hypothetical protein XYCOK13_18130 [Xylanibacillus composti]|uniref:Uncharacterized protein n=1 Tax=Xylanibacillus composti TaxID=1572762 RepID=A0A8J4M1T9_9BACL|nr:hypothetical protein XYCOK13_18130 [Xylanibacillus composti]